MFAKRSRSSPSRSKQGFAAALAGTLILLGLLIYGLVSVLGNVGPVVDRVGPIIGFLGSGPGVLLSVTVAVLLILWALPARQPKSESGHAGPSSGSERERVRLRAALREGEREREGLRSKLQKGERERERLRSTLREGERERERLRSELREVKRERERLRSALREGEREREELRSKLQESEQELERMRLDPQEDELERLKSQNEQLRAERDALEEKVKAHDGRVTLKQALKAAYREGLHLRGSPPGRRRKTGRGRKSSDEAAAKWAIHTNELIKEALGEGEARRFLGVGGPRSGDSSAEEQKQLNERLNRLSELIQRVDSLQPLELRPSFKDQERAS